MREYSNGMKATEFTQKQINVIYGCAKRGELKVEKWLMKELYKEADFYGYDYNGSTSDSERKVLRLLEKVFDRNYEEAQKIIDNMTDDLKLYNHNFKQNADRTLVA